MLPKTQRFSALDVFRGMTICFMIIVNTPGDGSKTFSPLLHANWHGFTPTDLVFPSFLFAVGNALSFVILKWRTWSNAAVVSKILKRTFLIFLIGYLMYWFPFVKWENGNLVMAPYADTRVFGVLQRIALCYGIAAFIIYYLGDKAAMFLSILFLLGYWILIYLFGEPSNPLGMQTNAGFYLDRWLLGERHMYHGEGVAFEPEGLLSTMPAIVNVLAGYLAGKFIQRQGHKYEMLAKLFLYGFGLLVLAWVWNYFFPVNKKLWTSSFVLLTVGLDLCIIAAIIYLVDFKNIVTGTYFFKVFGRNPLFIYLLSEIMVILFWFFRVDGQPFYNWLYYNVFYFIGDYWSSLTFALAVMLFCWLIGYWLDIKKIYVKV